MLRHVVLFTWTEDTTADRRAEIVAALRRLPEQVDGITAFSVGDDAALVEGNAHTALVADFPDADAFRRYAADPQHLAVVAEYVKPALAGRAAAQYEI